MEKESVYFIILRSVLIVLYRIEMIEFNKRENDAIGVLIVLYRIEMKMKGYFFVRLKGFNCTL